MPTLHTVTAAHVAAQIADLHTEIANIRRWRPSARRSALIEERETKIEELMLALEIGAEMASAEEVEALPVAAFSEDVQLAEMERAAEVINGRPDWTSSTAPKVMMASMWCCNGGYMGIVALDGGGFIVCVEYHGALILEVRCAAGDLAATLIAHARSVEALVTTTAPTAAVECFAY